MGDIFWSTERDAPRGVHETELRRRARRCTRVRLGVESGVAADAGSAGVVIFLYLPYPILLAEGVPLCGLDGLVKP